VRIRLWLPVLSLVLVGPKSTWHPSYGAVSVVARRTRHERLRSVCADRECTLLIGKFLFGH